MNWKALIVVLAVALTYSCRKTTVSNKIDLAGEWQFAIDSLDEGVTKNGLQKTWAMLFNCQVH
jgi:hypothetical protein